MSDSQSGRYIAMHKGVLHLCWRGDKGTERRSLKTTDAVRARALKLEIEAAEQQGAVKTYKVVDFWNRYRAYLGARPSGVSMSYQERAILPFFGDLLIGEVSPAIDPPADGGSSPPTLCEQYIAMRRAKGIANGTILSELSRLSCAFSYAVKKKWLTVDERPYLTMPPPSPPRDRYITKAEAWKFLGAIPLPHTRLFVILALTTGARAQAILSLTWERVDLGKSTLDLWDATVLATQKGRAIVPINDMMRASLLEAQKEARKDGLGTPTGPVIAWKGEKVFSLKKSLRAACKSSGIMKVTPHVFRHSAAVWMAEDEEPMSVISQFLGHKDTKTTERVYARYSPSYLRKAAKSLDFRPAAE